MEYQQTNLAKSSLKPIVTKFSINKKCFTGKVFDKIFGECISCQKAFNCRNCDEAGCISCDDGMAPLQGKCINMVKWVHKFCFNIFQLNLIDIFFCLICLYFFTICNQTKFFLHLII